jgi:putative DNA primase/helicase
MNEMSKPLAASGIVEHPTPQPTPFKVLTALELVNADLPPRETILAPWLPAKGLAMIYGPRGIGKTHLNLGIAYSIATGGTFLRWRAGRPRKVLYIDGEMPGQAMQERVAAISHAAPLEPPAPDFFRILAMDLQELGHGLNLADDAAQLNLEASIGDAEVLIVDNISTLANAGRENEAESWLPIQGWALEQRRAGRTVIFVHHAGKGGAQRGTSRREDVLDTVIALRRQDDFEPNEGARFAIHFEKNRGFHGDDAKPFEAALGVAGWSTRDLADADMARVVALLAEGMTEREIATETGFSKGRVGRLKAKAKEASLTGASGNA